MTSPQPQPDAAVVAAYQQQTQALRDKLEAIITAAWVALGTYRAADMAKFTKQIVPIVAAAQRQMSSMTVGYLTVQTRALTGRSQGIRVNPAEVTGRAARNGVDPAEVYGRPFHLVWRQLEELPHVPGSIEQAIKAGLDRAVQTGATDLQLSKVQTSQRVVSLDKKVIGYRRVLEGVYSCGLCIVASTQLYHKDDLMPIHPGCDCAVQKAYAYDGGAKLSAERLAAAHATVADMFGSNSAAARRIPGAMNADGKSVLYRDVIVTHPHQELGPVLAVRGASHKSLAELTKADSAI